MPADTTQDRKERTMLSRRIGDYFKGDGYKSHYLVAAAGTDNVEKVGAVIDRHAHGNALSAKVQVPWNALAVTDTKKLTITVKRYQSADGANWDAAETVKAATDVFVAAAPTLAAEGLIEVEQNLAGCKRYLKYGVTADLDAANTDTACYALLVNVGGGNELPQE